MKKQTPALVKAVPTEVLDILGAPPILSSEDENSYYATLALFAKEIAPSDMITWLMIKDLIDIRLEIARYRRFKPALIKQAYDRHKQAVIDNRRSELHTEIKTLRAAANLKLQKADAIAPYDASQIEARKAEVEAEFEKTVAAKRAEHERAMNAYQETIPQDSDFASTFPLFFLTIEKLEKAEQKFFAILREIERHVFGFGKALREELKIIEGEVLEKIEARTATA